MPLRFLSLRTFRGSIPLLVVRLSFQSRKILATMHWLHIFGAVLTLGLLLPFGRLYLARKKYQVEAERRGCGSLPDATNQGPLGIFTVYHFVRAVNLRTVSEALINWTNSAGNEIHTCRWNLMGDDFIFSRDPENFKALVVTQVDDYDLGDARMEILEPLLGTGVLNNQGEAWKHSRALLRPQFSRESISDLKMEERHLDDIWPVLDSQMSKDRWTGVTDLQAIFFDMTLGTSIDFLLGHKINLHAAHLAKSKKSDIEAAKMREHYRAGAAWSYIKFSFGRKYWYVHFQLHGVGGEQNHLRAVSISEAPSWRKCTDFKHLVG